jgi:aryl-alcohol dehydrogenase-like predicted oxidoreductase
MNNYMTELTFGTYKGQANDETDQRYYDALVYAFAQGIFKIDTAINYRNQRSERNIGDFLKKNNPSKVFISTKGGFISDINEDSDEMKIIRSINKKNIIADECHCMEPEFIKYQMEKSIQNLGENNIDVYYIHNPETQLLINNHKVFYSKICKVFELLEQSVLNGYIKSYGIATWHGLLADQNDLCYLSLSKLKDIAIDINGKENNFKWVMAPYNLQMTEIQTKSNQVFKGSTYNLLTASHNAGLSLVLSSPFLQGKFTEDMNNSISNNYDSILKNNSIENKYGFSLISSLLLPDINSVCLGMLNKDHIRQNIESVKEVTRSLVQ